MTSIRRMSSHSDFERKVKAPTDMKDVLALIDKQVKEHRVMLYMKGTPSAPQCGFSGQVVRVLNALGVDYASANVLQHEGIREGIKKYSYDNNPVNTMVEKCSLNCFLFLCLLFQRLAYYSTALR